jgi:catechol 2,3-dioxygenase-like lactoylglutathione lyase family enzyme
MLDHMTLTVRDLARSKAFYERALAPLGYRVLMEFAEMLGIGDDKPAFWMKQGDPPTTPQHIAFAAPSRSAVDAFYEAALAAGARDNGPPGIRSDYTPTYYAAFVFDPDDHPIEAVNHREAAAKRGARRPAAARGAAKAAGRGAAKGGRGAAAKKGRAAKGAARKAKAGARGKKAGARR